MKRIGLLLFFNPLNKLVSRLDLLPLRTCEVALLLLSGRGGKGEGTGGEDRCVARFSPAGRGGEGGNLGGAWFPFVEVIGVLLCVVDLGKLRCSSCRRGGGEYRAASSAFIHPAAGAWTEVVRTTLCAIGAMLIYEDPKPRLGAAEAIHGEGCRSVLWKAFQRYFFLLC